MLAESSAVARPHNETVEQICAYLAANYRQKFSLTEVAAQFYLSPYYLSRLFRRVTGQSIVDYINNRRIEAAQKLLETTELSISAVAEQTGFASAAHFRRVFREVMGTGPLQYRKGHKKSKTPPAPSTGNGTGGVCLYQMILCCAGKGLSP
ncbi:MAG: AraC family transcriptional regulator [Faecalibacterium prausnitzii]